MEENGTVLRNGEREVSGLKLSRPVMEKAVGLLMLGIEEVQLGHELATVADTEAQGVGTGVKPFDGITGLGIVRSAPAHPLADPRTSELAKPPAKTMRRTSSRVSRPETKSVVWTSRTSKPAR